MRAFFELHAGLRQEGPGSDEATREALRRVGPLPPDARVLDLGCGPGRQTLVLAEVLGVPITAIDLHAPFLAALEREAAQRGLAHLVRTRRADRSARARRRSARPPRATRSSPRPSGRPSARSRCSSAIRARTATSSTCSGPSTIADRPARRARSLVSSCRSRGDGPGRRGVD